MSRLSIDVDSAPPLPPRVYLRRSLRSSTRPTLNLLLGLLHASDCISILTEGKSCSDLRTRACSEGLSRLEQQFPAIPMIPQGDLDRANKLMTLERRLFSEWQGLTLVSSFGST